MHWFTKNPPFLWRVFSFAVLFLLLSGTLGPRIINNNLVGQFGFGVYGGAGKALVFAMIAFVILTYRGYGGLKLKAWSWQNGAWLAVCVLAYAAAWIGITHLQNDAHGFWWPFVVHLGLFTSVVGAFAAALGTATIKDIWSRYRRQLATALGIGVGFYVFLELVYALWSPLATVVLHGVYGLLQLFSLPSTIVPPYMLVLGDFAVEISKYCSGIESIALFTGIYVLVGLLDWKRFDHRKYLLAFLPGILLVQLCNILRIFLLMLIGYYIDPDIALRLFHTYAGMVFFIVSSAIFWRLTYKWMLRKA